MTVAGVGDDARGDGRQVGELAGQVGERGDRAQHGRDDRGEIEGAVDRAQAVLTRPRLGEEDADDGGDDADGRHDQREDQACLTECGPAENQRGDEHHGVGLEQVRGHARAVTYVVTDVVGDRGGVAGVVLGDVLLDLADEVGAYVGGLGEDAAADTHEHGEHGGAEPEAFEDRRRVTPEDEDHDRCAEQTQADGGHAHVRAGPERELHCRVPSSVTRGGGNPDVGPHGQPHAHVTDQAGERRTGDERHRPGDLQRPGTEAGITMRRQQQQQEERHHREDRQGAELPPEVRARTLLHGQGDPAHVLGALAGREHLASEVERHHERQNGDDAHHSDEGEIHPG